MSKSNPFGPRLHSASHQATGGDKLTGFPVLISQGEAWEAPINNFSNEQTVKTVAIPANSYSYIMFQALVLFNMRRSAAAKNIAYWYIKNNGVTTKGFLSAYTQTNSPTIIKGPAQPILIDSIFAGGQAGGTNVTVTATLQIANAADDVQILNYRMFGII